MTERDYGEEDDARMPDEVGESEDEADEYWEDTTR